MKPIKIKDLQTDTLFTRTPLDKPRKTQIWRREEYNKFARRYWCSRLEDDTDGEYFKGDTDVYIDFVF